MSGLAFDKATVRRLDADGRLHVAITNISKATVNPYYGREIPGYESLGLNPDRIYQLLRDPAELAAAALTFNNIPLLSRHNPVFATDPHPELVVGSTGTDAAFVAPYLRNSLVVWDAEAIAGIETGDQKELSCAYRYIPDMTPGTYEGVPYDGRMTQIVGNHVALVEVGRAGPDVVVSDCNPFPHPENTVKTNRKTAAIRAALKTYLPPLLAQDAQLPDIKIIVGNVKTATLAQDAERIAGAVLSKGKFAQDAAPKADALKKLVMDAASEADEAEDDDDEKEKEKDPDPKAEDEDDEDKDKKDDKQAMDAAISAAVTKAKTETEAATIARMNAIRKAEKDVFPLVGEVAAMDSAEAVYKFVLDQAGVDTTGVHPSAYAAMVKMIPRPGERKPTTLAQDAAASGDALQTLFPTAGKLIKTL